MLERMPLPLALFGFLLLSCWSGFQLWRAAKLGRINMGVVDAERRGDIGDVYFWFHVALASAIVLMACFIVVAAIWKYEFR